MSGRYLLDTNIIIALFAGDGLIKERLIQIEEVFTSPFVLGELYYGAYRSRQSRRNIGRIDELALKSAILPCDSDQRNIMAWLRANSAEREPRYRKMIFGLRQAPSSMG